MVKITNLGHACFLIENENCRLIIDPYDDATGYPPLRAEANMLLMTHGHHDHSFEEGVTLTPGGSFDYKAIDTFHDDERGAKRGPNKVFVIDAGGYKICHMGDLGHLPSPEQYAAIGKVDVLILPVGGYYTIDAAEAAEVVNTIGPKVVIPMHYNPGGLKNPIAGLAPFLEKMPGWEVSRGDLEGKREFIVSEDSLKRHIEILAMPPRV